MPNWKKVIVSGSNAELNSLNVSTSLTASNILIYGSGSTILDIQGSQGQLFSVTDDLTGDIFTVSDISGIPILNVNADGTTTQDGNLIVSGNVGIGTIAPSTTLDINGNTKTNSLLINTTTPIASSLLTINNTTTSTSTNVTSFHSITRANTVDTPSASSYGTVNRLVNSSNNTNSFIVTQNNVARTTGTGDSTSIYSTLNETDIEGSGVVGFAIGGSNVSTLNNSGGTVNQLWGIHTEVQLTAGTAGNISLLNFDFDQSVGTTITGDFQFIHISNDQPVLNIGGTARALNIESNLPSFFSGSISIGTPLPSQLLHVAGNARIEGALYDSNNSSGTSGQVLASTATGTDWVSLSEIQGVDGSGTTNFITKWTPDGGTIGNSQIFDNGTNVGIGITAPSKKLHIVGDGVVVDSGFNTGVASLYLSHTNTSNQHKAGIFTTYTTGYGRSSSMQFALNSEMNVNTVTTADAKMTILEGGNVGIGTTTPGAKLDIEGDILIKAANLSNQENLDVDTGTEVVATVPVASFTAAFFDFVIKKGTNIRSGTVYACHDGTSVEYTETSTADLGDTSDVVLSVDISGGQMRLLANAATTSWSVKSFVRAI